MLLSINWLRDYLLKMDVKINPEDLAEQLTMLGLAVEAIKKPEMGWENVVVGRIEKIEKHPDADKLQITYVVTEDNPESKQLQIVCGASNIAEGDIVPVALPGAVLPGNFEIKVSKLRGVESEGMICSGKELEISQDSEGILQLPKDSPIGEPLTRLLGHDDTVLEFDLTPNRADCLSVIGLAREIAPLLKTKLREPKPSRFRITPHRTSSIVTIEVENPDLCPRYVGRVIDNLKVEESPDWIKQRLQSVGVRPINNIVDITNFVMLEYGQPIHAFDLRRIQSGTVKITACKAPTEFKLLSDETVQLEENDILIQDGDRPIALAGIMGGANTQILEDTTSILLESAAFDPNQIRRTARRLALHTESSKRFEKGVDIVSVASASERAAALFRECFDANVYHPPIDTNDTIPKERVISIDMREVRKVTGLKQLSSERAADALESIGINCHKKSINILSVKIPKFRLDLDESIDLTEEIARLVGYETIPLHYPLSHSTYNRLDESQFDREIRTKQALASFGLRETIHYSFTSEENLRKFGVDTKDLVRLQNPLSEEMEVLRPSLLPSLLQTYSYNRNRKSLNQRLFEVATGFFPDARQLTKVREIPLAAGLLSGSLTSTDWKKDSADLDFYRAKGLVDELVRKLTTVKLVYEPITNHKLFHPNRSAQLKLGLSEVGYIGEIHPYVRDQILETDEPIILFELNLGALKRFERTTTVRYREPSKFPSVELDIAILADKAITSQALLETIKHAGSNLLSAVQIFDIYEGDTIPLGKRSLAFHLAFLSPDRTLQEDEVGSLKEKIVQALSEKHSAQLRA